MVFINKIMTIIGKIVEALIVIVISIPIIVFIFMIVYLYNIVINLFKNESSSNNIS